MVNPFQLPEPGSVYPASPAGSPDVVERKPVTSIDIDGTTVTPSPDGEWPRVHNGGPDDVVVSGPGHRDTI